jgi:hypothetical protein
VTAFDAGAGEGNRTLVVSLEGFCSTIELHPPRGSIQRLPPGPKPASQLLAAKREFGGGEGWIRTNVGARPTDLQSAPFNHSGTSPRNSRLSTKAGVSGKQNREFPTRGRRVEGCRHPESNGGPTAYKAVALPAELCRRLANAHFTNFRRDLPFVGGCLGGSASPSAATTGLEAGATASAAGDSTVKKAPCPFSRAKMP